MILYYWAVPEKNPYSSHGRDWSRGFWKTKNILKKSMKCNWNFQRGGEVLEKIPSLGEV